MRFTGIGMSDFDHQGGIQTDLFCEIDDRGAQSSDRRDLSVAIDAVRDKFGDTTLPSAANPTSTINRLWAKRKPGRCGSRFCPADVHEGS